MPIPATVGRLREFTFLEFFAGGGMARAGLGSRWECLFANDFDSKKAAIYAENWGGDTFQPGDVSKAPLPRLSASPDLAWASFPCQDLSLAGARAGLRGKRSGSFWGFWEKMVELKAADLLPNTVVLENVVGTITARGGQDFATLLDTLKEGGYRSGALVIDAINFLPHSRPRLFIIAVRDDLPVPKKLLLSEPIPHWTPTTLSSALKTLEYHTREDWISWRLPMAATRVQPLSELIEENPSEVCWNTAAETRKLLEMMSETNRAKVACAQLAGRKVVGTLYRRTRPSQDGSRQQRAEVRFDEVAGCLRTPGGGSSRQTILVVEGKRIRSRLLSPREAARLMGLSESYILPANYNEAYHLLGDGVAVPVVRHIADYLLEPILRAQVHLRTSAA